MLDLRDDSSSHTKTTPPNPEMSIEVLCCGLDRFDLVIHTEVDEVCAWGKVSDDIRAVTFSENEGVRTIAIGQDIATEVAGPTRRYRPLQPSTRILRRLLELRWY